MPALLPKRQNVDNDGYSYDTHDTWNDWVRWLILGLIILGGIFLFVVLSCFTARRRRRQGFTPYRGTGWTVRHGPVQYNQNYQQPAPPYQANDTTTPYYPTQQPPAYGSEMTNMPPKDFGPNAHGNTEAYAPPPGPPPAHVK